MQSLNRLLAIGLFALASPIGLWAQEPAKPGPEHEMLKKWEGTWDVTMKMEGMESKGSSTYKMELGGLWLTSDFSCDFGGQKFTGKGLDSYDAAKKKFVSVWVDSWMTTPLLMEGSFDKDKKALTLSGDGKGPDGKPVKFKSVTEWKDSNTMEFKMYMADSKEPGFTIIYKRKK